MSHQIVDDFLPVDVHSRLKSLMFSNEFPWYVIQSLVATGDSAYQDKRKCFKFYHALYCNHAPTSNFYKEIIPILEVIKPSFIMSVRAFLTTYTGEKYNQGFHIDYEPEKFQGIEGHLKNCVYYINTNNGGTQFEGGEFIESRENRALLFNANQRHAAVTPDDTNIRIVLNLLYI